MAAAAARAQKRAAARERKRQVRRRRREHYERGCTWGRPAASILYGMAREMHMETNYMLWCAAALHACHGKYAVQATPLSQTHTSCSLCLIASPLHLPLCSCE